MRVLNAIIFKTSPLCFNPIFFSSGFLSVGTWLSLVEHSLGVRGVGSSNLPVPTILFTENYRWFRSLAAPQDFACMLPLRSRRQIGSSYGFCSLTGVN